MAIYYIRTDGSDSNAGTANTSGGAFASLKKALDTALANGGGGHTIRFNTGSFTEPSTGWDIGRNFTSLVTINTVTGLADVTLAISGATNFQYNQIANNMTWTNITFQAGASVQYGLLLQIGKSITNIIFNTCRFISGTGSSAYAVIGNVVTGTSAADYTFNTCTFVNAQTTVNSSALFQFRNSAYATAPVTLNLNDCIAICPAGGTIAGVYLEGATVNITRGTFVGHNSYGVRVGSEASAGSYIGSCTLKGINTSSDTSHSCLIGYGMTSGLVTGSYFGGGNDTLVLKGCQNIQVYGNFLMSGTGPTLLFKGCFNCTVERNILINSTYTAAISNYDGGAGFLGKGNICRYNTIYCQNNTNYLKWDIANGDDPVQTNIVDYNVVVIMGSGNYGQVGTTTNIATLALLVAAWTANGYITTGNDSHTVDGNAGLLSLLRIAPRRGMRRGRF